jgi:uncharacterized protein (DUF2132 family)
MSDPGDGASSGANDPLHGITLEMIVTTLVERYGWQELGEMIDIRCFQLDPSVASSLKFLRRTPWARKKVEALYVYGPPTR